MRVGWQRPGTTIALPRWPRDRPRRRRRSRAARADRRPAAASWPVVRGHWRTRRAGFDLCGACAQAMIGRSPGHAWRALGDVEPGQVPSCSCIASAVRALRAARKWSGPVSRKSAASERITSAAPSRIASRDPRRRRGLRCLALCRDRRAGAGASAHSARFHAAVSSWPSNVGEEISREDAQSGAAVSRKVASAAPISAGGPTRDSADRAARGLSGRGPRGRAPMLARAGPSRRGSRMQRIAFDLGRPPHGALDEHAGPVAVQRIAVAK